NANGNWNNGVPTGDGQDVNFSQSISGGDQTVTNLFSSNGSALNYLRLNTGGSSLLTVITQTGTGIDSTFGLQLNARDTLILNGAGDGRFIWQFCANNIGFANNGTIIVNGGSLDINTTSAGGGGFQNNSAGQIQINSGASLVIERTTGSWSGSDTLNQGTIT